MTDQTLTVLFFAWVRDITGKDHEDVPISSGGLTGTQLIEILVARHPGLKDRADQLHLAVNQEHVSLSARINAGDEVALFPPVTGG